MSNIIWKLGEPLVQNVCQPQINPSATDSIYVITCDKFMKLVTTT